MKINYTTKQKITSQEFILSAPAAVEYYPKVGFTEHPSAWVLVP